MEHYHLSHLPSEALSRCGVASGCGWGVVGVESATYVM